MNMAQSNQSSTTKASSIPKPPFDGIKASEEDKKVIQKLLTMQMSVTEALTLGGVKQANAKSTLTRSQIELCQEHRDAEARVSRCGRAGRPSLKYAARQDSGLACTCGAVLAYFEDHYPRNLSDA